MVINFLEIHIFGANNTILFINLQRVLILKLNLFIETYNKKLKGKESSVEVIYFYIIFLKKIKSSQK